MDHVLNKDVHQCFFCTFQFVTLSELKQHVETMHAARPETEEHIVDTASIPLPVIPRTVPFLQTDEISYKCDICSFTSKHKHNIARHTRQVHEKIRPYTCDYCHEGFFHKHRLLKHKTDFHKDGEQSLENDNIAMLNVTKPTVSVGTVVKKQKCDECDYESRYKSCMSSHRTLVHAKVYPYICRTCHQGFFHRGRWLRHVSFKHTKRKGKSLEKNARKPDKLTFIMPSSQHTFQESPGVSATTNLFNPSVQFSHQQSLEGPTTSYPRMENVNVEDGEEKELKIYKCDKCPFETTYERSKARHVREVHENLHPYNCRICSKAFFHKYRLQHHIEKDHNTEKEILSESVQPENLYKCDKCTFQTSHKRNKVRHMREVHWKIRPYRCRLCHETFFRSYKLHGHITSAHPLRLEGPTIESPSELLQEELPSIGIDMLFRDEVDDGELSLPYSTSQLQDAGDEEMSTVNDDG